MAEANQPNPYALQMQALEDLKKAQEQDEIAQRDFQKQRNTANLFANVGQAFSRTPITQAEIMAGVKPVDRSQGYAERAMKPWDAMGQDQADSSKNILNKYRLIQEQANVLRDQQTADLTAKKFALDTKKEDAKTAWEMQKPQIEHKNKLEEIAAAAQAKVKEEKANKSLSPANLADYGTGRDSINNLNQAESALSKVESKMGPVMGKLYSVNPYDTDVMEFNSNMKGVAQLVGKFLEGGKMTDNDRIHYQTMMPAITDTPEVARRKVEGLRQKVLMKQQNDMKALSQQGYDTRGLAAEEKPSVAIPTKPQQPSGTAIAAPNYIRRVAPNGRVVLYDQNKKPIGYEDEMGK
jgi:hypothetical protein